MSEEEYRKIRDMIDNIPEKDRWALIILALLFGNAPKGVKDELSSKMCATNVPEQISPKHKCEMTKEKQDCKCK